MAHTFTSLYFHVVFSTKRRIRLISAEIRPRLWSYIGGIARENDFRALCVGGMAEHAHALLSLKPRDAHCEGGAAFESRIKRVDGRDDRQGF